MSCECPFNIGIFSSLSSVFFVDTSLVACRARCVHMSAFPSSDSPRTLTVSGNLRCSRHTGVVFIVGHAWTLPRCPTVDHCHITWPRPARHIIPLPCASSVSRTDVRFFQPPSPLYIAAVRWWTPRRFTSPYASFDGDLVTSVGDWGVRGRPIDIWQAGQQILFRRRTPATKCDIDYGLYESRCLVIYPTLLLLLLLLLY